MPVLVEESVIDDRDIPDALIRWLSGARARLMISQLQVA